MNMIRFFSDRLSTSDYLFNDATGYGLGDADEFFTNFADDGDPSLYPNYPSVADNFDTAGFYSCYNVHTDEEYNSIMSVLDHSSENILT